MTTPEALNALAYRVEREEPSRELDAAILVAMLGAGWIVSTANGWACIPYQEIAEAPHYTTSLDAAVTLVPPEYANAWSAGDNSGEYRIFGRLGYEHEATGLTPAAALTAAALRARAADMQARAEDGAPHPSRAA